MNKYVFLALSAFVAFNFHVSASEDVEQDVASVGMPTTNQQPLMLTYDPKWHAASEADRKLYNPEIATLYPELPIRDVYGLHGLVYKMNQIPDKHSYLGIK